MKLKGWTEFGWQGINLELPLGWNVGKIEGKKKAGYVRIDDDETVRLEIKWEKPRGGAAVSDIVERYVDQARRKARKAKLSFEVNRNIGLVELPGRETECVSWESDFNAYSMVSRCEECGRALLMRVLYRPGERLHDTAKKIFESLRDHPADGDERWSIFGFAFTVPQTFLLDKNSLKTGCLELAFYDKRDEIELVQSSVAEIVLKTQSLESWFQTFYKKRLAKFRAETRETEFRGHAAVQCEGRPSTGKALLSALQKQPHLHCQAWHCERSNKLFVFRLTSTEQDDRRFDKYLRLVKCH